MTAPRYRVQTRTHGEPWRTQSTHAELPIAQHRAEQLIVQRDMSAFAVHPYVRIMQGVDCVALWQYGRVVIGEAVAS